MINDQLNNNSTKVLLIDKGDGFNKRLSSVLKDWDMDVLSASSGRDALNLIEDELPDLIILDVILPDVCGYELCKQLRRNNNTRRIPLIIISILDSEDRKIEGLESGADDYIVKPCSINELVARLRAVLRSYH
ncbi:MAG: response regulator [bacterium]